MTDAAVGAPRRIGLVERYDKTSRPRLFLAVVVVVLYVPSFFLSFIVDDYRSVRQFRDYRAGRIDRLHLYEFVRNPQQVAAERDAWIYPWWIADDLRFRFFRPVAEHSLYLDYLLFGERALGYRITSIVLYILGVWVVLGLYRTLADERRARWAAMIFAIAGGHAIPVIFPSARCDLCALAAGILSIWMMARFLLAGGAWRLLSAIVTYLIALGSKEVSLGLVLGPPLMYWALSGREPIDASFRRRAAIATASFGIVAAAFLAFYAAGSYASNGDMMLDPLRATSDYLARAPGRSLLLLISWVIQINPFLLYSHEQQAIAKIWLIMAGIPALALFSWAVFRWNAKDRSVQAMAIWSLIFLPVLACTPADDRVMTIPSVGLAYLTAAWLTHRKNGPLVKLAVVLFIVIPIVYTEAVIAGVALVEWKANHQIDAGAASFRRPVNRDDTVFFLNAPQPDDALWAQDRADARIGPQRPGVAVLSDIIEPVVERVGPRTLKLTTQREHFLSSFVGRMARVRGKRIQQGVPIDHGEYSVMPTRVEGGQVTELTIDFRRPLDSDQYRFFMLSVFGSPAEFRFTTTQLAK